MKNYSVLLRLNFVFLMFYIISFCFSEIRSETLGVISFSERFSLEGNSICAGLLPKESRIRKNAACINIQANNVIPDSIQKCVLYAIDIWESSVKCHEPIMIDVYFQPIENDIETDVIFLADKNNYFTPNALYKNLYSENVTDLSDGTIHINSSIKWDCSIDENIKSDYPNLTLAILRAISKILGFGSTIKSNNDGLLYFSGKRYYSRFDKLIISSDNEKITKIGLNAGRANKELTDFYLSETRNFYVYDSRPLYELEKGIGNDQSVLSYLKCTNSLMSYTPKIGSYFLQIDTITTSVLREIGWTINDPTNIEIVSEEGGNTGIMSAYTSHKFSIRTSNTNKITSQTWRLSLPLATGEEEVINYSNSNECLIPAIEKPEKYKKNVNGDIYASLDFSCVINGMVCKANTYRISLELKPKVEYAKIVNIKNFIEQQTYDAYYEIKYYGADRLTVSVEEEYGSWLKTKIIREPYWVSGVCKQISAPFYAWIDFTVENKYGKDIYTIELGPNGEVMDPYVNLPNYSKKNIEIENKSYFQDTVENIEVYNIQGVHLGTYSDWSQVKNSLEKGMYILHEKLETGEIITRKEIVR